MKREEGNRETMKGIRRCVFGFAFACHSAMATALVLSRADLA